MTSQCMQMNVNIYKSAPRRLDCGFTAHVRNICPRTPWSSIQTRHFCFYVNKFEMLFLLILITDTSKVVAYDLFYNVRLGIHKN